MNTKHHNPSVEELIVRRTFGKQTKLPKAFLYGEKTLNIPAAMPREVSADNPLVAKYIGSKVQFKSSSEGRRRTLTGTIGGHTFTLLR